MCVPRDLTKSGSQQAVSELYYAGYTEPHDLVSWCRLSPCYRILGVTAATAVGPCRLHARGDWDAQGITYGGIGIARSGIPEVPTEMVYQKWTRNPASSD